MICKPLCTHKKNNIIMLPSVSGNGYLFFILCYLLPVFLTSLQKKKIVWSLLHYCKFLSQISRILLTEMARSFLPSFNPSQKIYIYLKKFKMTFPLYPPPNLNRQLNRPFWCLYLQFFSHLDVICDTGFLFPAIPYFFLWNSFWFCQLRQPSLRCCRAIYLADL